MGQLIDGMDFRACSIGKCATMGETLEVRKGAPVQVSLQVRDPRGTSNSPYTFNNPALLQVGVEQPINRPELAHVELIRGKVTGPVPAHTTSGEPNHQYYDPLAPDTTYIAKQWTHYDWGFAPVKRMVYTFTATEDGYVRARGSNLPPGTPNARDMDGNPLADSERDNIPCDDPLCPPHIEGVLDQDVEAWADIWFYSNPIFIDVGGRHKRKPPHFWANNHRNGHNKDNGGWGND
jgi:hypothetical protein